MYGPTPQHWVEWSLANSFAFQHCLRRPGRAARTVQESIVEAFSCGTNAGPLDQSYPYGCSRKSYGRRFRGPQPDWSQRAVASLCMEAGCLPFHNPLNMQHKSVNLDNPKSGELMNNCFFARRIGLLLGSFPFQTYAVVTTKL